MTDLDIQRSIIQTIKTIAGERIRNVNFTKSFTGIVKEVNGFECIVEISGSDSKCVIPHNLKSFIEIEDIVIIQDIANNRFRKIVQGVISSTRKNMFHIYDPVTDSIISSILDLWDEETEQTIPNIVFEIE